MHWLRRLRSRDSSKSSAQCATDVDDDADIYDEEINERHVYHEPTYVISTNISLSIGCSRHSRNKAFIDIRLCPGITTPLVVVG